MPQLDLCHNDNTITTSEKAHAPPCIVRESVTKSWLVAPELVNPPFGGLYSVEMWNVLLIVCAAYAVYFEKNPKPGPGLTSVPSFIISGALDPGFDGHWTQKGEFDFGFPVYRLDETTGNSIGSSVTDSPVVYSSQSLPEGLQAPAASSDFHVVPTYALPSEIEQSQIIPSEEVSTQPIPSDTSGKFIYPYKMPDTTIHYIFDSDVDYSNGIFGGKFMFSSQLPCPLILV